MIHAVVTGASGFLGKHLSVALSRCQGVTVQEVTRKSPDEYFEKALGRADIVFHLAGVNRPKYESEYHTVNAGVTQKLIETLDVRKRSPLVVFASSIQVENKSAYGASKRKAEELLVEANRRFGLPVRIYRLPNVFGKWCRPDCHSVVATFCYNTARRKEIDIIEADNELTLVYVDDVIQNMCSQLKSISLKEAPDSFQFETVTPLYRTTVGDLARLISGFSDLRMNLMVPDVSDPFVQALYATYISYLPEGELAVQPEKKIDDRGWLFELIKSKAFGQIFVSKTRSGISRGNHVHDSKVEKFCVIQGEGLICFRQLGSEEILEYRVSDDPVSIVDIPPGYTHSITNVGEKDMICLFWASEVLDHQWPDTYGESVFTGNRGAL